MENVAVKPRLLTKRPKTKIEQELGTKRHVFVSDFFLSGRWYSYIDDIEKTNFMKKVFTLDFNYNNK